ncbi:MAG: DUF5058 family protein [Clostridia bacterium]|nr:DUF5058 family protein [Clostridia bacterium]
MQFVIVIYKESRISRLHGTCYYQNSTKHRKENGCKEEAEIMKDYLLVATNPSLYLVTAILLGIVFLQAIIFLRMALVRARRLEVPKAKMIKAAKTAAITTIIPAVATVIALITMAPVLGLAFSWARLSVIGSLGYELMAAEIGAAAAGTSISSPDYGASAFLASVFAMTVGSAPALFFTGVFYKKYKSGLSKGLAKQKDKVLVGVLMSALMIGLYASIVMDPIRKGGAGLITIIASEVSMILVNFLIKKFNVKWLNDFALSIAMIAGMAAAIVFSL